MPRRDADADGEASGAMQGPGPPRVPVDWDALEMALTWRSDEWELRRQKSVGFAR